jgi:excisionase family DNA binding protein
MAELLSIQEVAQITGLHEITIRRYIRAGELEAVRIGRRIRIRREALDRLLKPMHPDAAPEAASESMAYLREGAAVYEAADLGKAPVPAQALIGGVALRLVQLPLNDITLVAQMVTRLQQQRQAATSRRLSPAEIVTEARRQAALLSDVPRAEIAARFEALAEEIRGQAIARGTAIEGDWLGD